MSLVPIQQNIADLATLIEQVRLAYTAGLAVQMAFPTAAALETDASLTASLADGRYVRVLEHNGFDLVKVTGGLVHYTADTGAQFRLRMDRASPLHLGAVGNDVENDAAAIDAVLASDCLEVDLLGRTYFYDGSFVASKPVFNGRIRDANGVQDFGLVTGAISLADLSLDLSFEAEDWHNLPHAGIFSGNAKPNAPGSGRYHGFFSPVTATTQAAFVFNRDHGICYTGARTGSSWDDWIRQARYQELLGVGQTSTDVRASRAFDVAYTNTSLGPMLVQVSYGAVTSNAMFCYMEIDEGNGAGFQRRMEFPGDRHMSVVLTGIIPPGGQYRVSGSNITHVRSWWETAA
jgi:hypothetical protein